MVLLKEERMCAAPRSTTLRSRRLRTTFFSDFLGAIVNHSSYFFFLPAMVRFGPLRVRAFCLVFWPRTGRPLR